MKFKLYINWKNRFRYNFITKLCMINKKKDILTQKKYDVISKI